MINATCTNCGRPYPDRGVPHVCPGCGGLFDLAPIPFDPKTGVDPSQPGIWRFRASFGLPPELEAVSLGEGSTPLTWAQVGSRRVAFKDETRNPTGSFKDRGSALITAWLRYRGVRVLVEDSSGNAGASLAAYAACAQLQARIYAPASASGPKRRQIEAYGAELVTVDGPRSRAAQAVLEQARAGTAYASHAHLPFNLPGYATLAYELFSELGGRLPGAVILPAGQGGLLLGLARGWDALRIANSEGVLPRLIAVQARRCAPLWAAFTAGPQGLRLVGEDPTLAEGVSVRHPARGDAVLAAVRRSQGSIEVVDEEQILPARAALARQGYDVEPTSAIVWPVLKQRLKELPDPVVVILTGAGYKYEAAGGERSAS